MQNDHLNQHQQQQMENPFNEPYNQMAAQNQMAGKTHTKFPQTQHPRFITADGKRPGSAGNRKKNLPVVSSKKKWDQFCKLNSRI